ncbi:hypothetical protein EMCRGX_G029880 [Ephydatia muelleri]
MSRRRETRYQKTHDLSSSLVAAALQDHICKTVCFRDPVAEWRRKSRAQTLDVSRCSRGEHSQSFSEHRAAGLRNSGPTAFHSTEVTLQQLSSPCIQQRYESKAKLAATRSRNAVSEVEVVLDAKLPALTLAQRLGLVTSPYLPPLSEAEWASVKSASLARGDSRQPCPICQTEYGLKEQVLLSCSHVFHKTCLQSFERYSGKKHCPMCRRLNYQTRLIHEGARQWREIAAARIQAVWRGYKKYFEQKLSALTEQLVGTCSSKALGVQSLINKTDQNIAASRNISRLLDLRLQRHEVDWVTMTTKAREKAATTDCAVCLAPLQTFSEHQGRALTMLSCSHVFHTPCILALEQYTQDSVHLCPICRVPYERVGLGT